MSDLGMQHGRIPMSPAEHKAVDKLLKTHHDGVVPAGMTRRDPGNTGPLVVEIGQKVFCVEGDGTVTEDMMAEVENALGEVLAEQEDNH